MPDPDSINDGSLLRTESAGQVPLPLASEGVHRWVWESQFGAMLIEVIDDVPFVNGVRVERATEDSRSL